MPNAFIKTTTVTHLIIASTSVVRRKAENLLRGRYILGESVRIQIVNQLTKNQSGFDVHQTPFVDNSLYRLLTMKTYSDFFAFVDLNEK